LRDNRTTTANIAYKVSGEGEVSLKILEEIAEKGEIVCPALW